MKISPNAPCPCGTQAKFKKCCRPILQGRPAPTPEALMRSRYTAYVVGDIQHIMATTHPESPHRLSDADAWAREISAFSQQTEFLELQVQSSRDEDNEGWVAFVARLRQGEQVTQMEENSHFLKVESQWLYMRAESPQE